MAAIRWTRRNQTLNDPTYWFQESPDDDGYEVTVKYRDLVRLLIDAGYLPESDNDDDKVTIKG